MEDPFVILVSSDGVPFELPRRVAYLSNTIKDFFEAKPENLNAECVFADPAINYRDLNYCVKYLRHLNKHKILKTKPIPEFDYPLAYVVDVLRASLYLNI